MLTTELCARLCADFPLQLPDAPACFTCTRVVLDPWDDAEGGTVFIGEGTVDRPDRFYLLCAPGAPQHPNAAHYADPALTLPLVRAVYRLLEPERRLRRRLHRLEQACLSGGLKDLLAAARPEAAIPLYEKFVALCREKGFHTETGEFGADMLVHSVNDGPLTLIVDTDQLSS